MTAHGIKKKRGNGERGKGRNEDPLRFRSLGEAGDRLRDEDETENRGPPPAPPPEGDKEKGKPEAGWQKTDDR